MARLSNCNLHDRSRVMVRPVNVLRALFFTAVLCALSIGQIHLGFIGRDLMIETRKLQDVHTEMLDRRNALTAEVEGKRIQTFEQLNGENPLGLGVCQPDRRFRGRVTASALKRWHESASPAGLFTYDGEDIHPPVRNALVALGERMLASPSFARTPDDGL